MKLIWTQIAYEDRQSIAAFIAHDDRDAAVRLDYLFEKRCEQLRALPILGRPGRKVGSRELVVHRHYLLVYDISGDTIRILRLLHTARLWPSRASQ